MTFARCLASLEDAVASAATLGLDTTAASGVIQTARARARFPSDTYVLAFVGGTGVGKSTLLNALAGEQVSRASARRPTTTEPVAWIPAGKERELADLIGWLGITSVREHRGERMPDVAVLDLPDIDSVAAEHRARVDELLPRVDAVAWVLDPQKYGDEVAHAPYLAAWGPRIARQIVVLNRADLLSSEEAARVRDDLRARLRDDGLPDTDVALTRARDGAPGVATLQEWIESGVEAKRVITSRSIASARDAARALAHDAGVEQEVRPLVDPSRRKRAMDDVANGALALVDIRGLERQAVAATRLAARPRGAGPFGHVTSLIYRVTGRARVSADPTGYLRRWRTRGSLAPALEPLRDLVAVSLPSVPMALRARVAGLSDPAALEPRLADAIDRTLAAEVAGFTVPTSAAWSVIGFGQWLVTAALLFAALWFAALFVVHDTPTGSLTVPVLGPVPAPVVLVAAVLLVGYLLANALRLHAGWLGRRWARRIGARITSEVRARVHDAVLVPLDRMEAAREQLARAAKTLNDDCA